VVILLIADAFVSHGILLCRYCTMIVPVM
jgi:hypothetical protein